MKFYTSILLVILSLFLTGAGSPQKKQILTLTQHEKQWISQNPTISYTGDPDWLPYEAFTEEGTYIGIVADHLKYITEQTKLRFEPRVVSSWSESLSMAASGEVDVISADAADDILNKTFLPVKSYSHNPIVIVMGIEDNYVDDIYDISNKKIAIVKDYGYTADIYRVYPKIEFIEVENVQEAFDGVEEKKFDAILVSMAIANYSISKMHAHTLKIVGKTSVMMDLTLFVSKDKPILYEILNKTLVSMPKAEKSRIMNYWMELEYDENIDYTLIYKISGGLISLLVLALLWNRRLGEEIKHRNEIQVSLEESQKDLKNIFDNAQTGLMYITGDRHLIKANQRLADIFGYEDPEEMIGLDMRALHLSEENYIEYGKMNFEPLRMGVKRYIEYELRRKDGTHLWCELSGKVLDDNIPADLSKGVLWTINDITPKVELEQKQKLLQERLSYAIEGSNDGLWDWNIQTNQIYYSPRWKEILGYQDSEIENVFSVWEELIHPDDLQASWDEFNRFSHSKEKDKQFSINFRMKHKQGHYVNILSRAKKVFDGNGELERLVGTHMDVTELYRVQEAYKQERDRGQLYLDTAEVILIALDNHARVTMLNRKGEELLEYSEDELLGKVWFEIGILPEDIALNVKHFFETLITLDEAPQDEFQHELTTKSGKHLMFSFRSSLLFDDAGNCIGLLSSAIDITGKVKAEKDVQVQHEFLKKIMNSVNESIMVIEKDYTVSMMNDTAKHNIHSKWIKDIDNPKCYEIAHHRDTPCDGLEHPCPLENTIQMKQSVKVLHTHHDEGEAERFVEITAVPMLNEQNEVTAIIETAHDVTDLKAAQASLLHQAEHDALTNLPNRVLFLDRMNQALKHANRRKEKVAVLFLDLDHFKEINDSLGHSIGDMLLTSVATRLSDSIRESDTVARLGGDEFAIVIHHIENSDIVSNVVQKIFRAIKKPFEVQGHQLYVTLSIGIALFPNDGVDSEILLKNADAAMYKAKNSGRDNYQYYTEDMTERAFERLVLETQLRQSLEKNQIEVYYQMQVDAVGQRIVGMEALVRWRHPNMGMVSPDKFIPLAEETGFILELDAWVMKEALLQFRKWYSLGYNPGLLSLNLSPLRLEHPDFIQELSEVIEQTQVRSEWLNLEVTEGQIMRNPEDAIKTLKEIHKLGIKLAIDDFGTGYSSLSYLKRLPIDKLKIDQSFIRDIPQSKDDVEITRTIISMAQGLNLDVIAEGVEKSEQKEFLVSNGCREIQGFFYHFPSSSSEVEKLLVDNAFIKEAK